jgi:DNA-binding transcriptional ArsR family regulator
VNREDMDSVFFALADPTRREVIRRLSEEGPITVSDLAKRMPVTRQAVAKHLSALDEAGLIASRQDGRRKRYRLVAGPLTEAMGWMTDVGAQWDARLAALHRHLER